MKNEMAIGFDPEKASPRQERYLRFVAGGFVGALRGKNPTEYVEVIRTFAESRSLQAFMSEFLEDNVNTGAANRDA